MDTYKCPKCGKKALAMPGLRKEREKGTVNVICTACGLKVAVPAGDDSEALDVYGDFVDLYQEIVKNAKKPSPVADDKYEYSLWDPPAASTVFCKMSGVPYEVLRSRLATGTAPAEFTPVKDKLEKHEYRCKTCVCFEDPLCTYKKKRPNPDAICKKFEPA
nr:hypothetical protein [Candidatus Sigynarchaeota archaeon]